MSGLGFEMLVEWGGGGGGGGGVRLSFQSCEIAQLGTGVGGGGWGRRSFWDERK